MEIPGKTTRQGTDRHRRQFPISFRPQGPDQFYLSEVGFGGYRLNLRAGSHEQALRFALQNGINVLDTSANYGDGGSERLIGRVMGELIDGGELQRESLFVVSKVGYVQGFNYALAEQRKQEGRPFPNLVKFDNGLDHCIHPEFITDQLTRSLERLNLQTIDAYLLHNPEYYLKWAHRARIPLAEARREYFRRLDEAFRHLETEVAAGRIQWYGISSNTFPVAENRPDFTALEKVWTLAEKIGDHHFRLIQLPINLFETGGVTEQNQNGRGSVLDFAADRELTVLTNRPLNALSGDSLTRLSDVLMPNYPATPEEVSTAVDESRHLEEQFRREMLPALPLAEEDKRQLMEYLALGLILDGQWAGFGTYQNWRDVQQQFLLRRSQTAVEFLSNWENSSPELLTWLERYIEAANITLAAVSAFYQERAATRMARIKNEAHAADPDWQADSLSQTAVRALRATRGVSVVLVGMRQQEYVQDILRDLRRPVTPAVRNNGWRKLAAAQEERG